MIEEVLRKLGVRTAVRTSLTGANVLVSERFQDRQNSSANRIHYMAKVRNAARDPLYKMGRRGEHFDKVDVRRYAVRMHWGVAV